MSVLCLSENLDDLKKRLGDIIVAFSTENKPIYAKDLKVNDAMAILLKDAIKPNLVQTLIGTPALIHGGPFANISHGCNSIIATKLALTYANYVVTEAGFGADLGAEKFLDMKCRVANLKPNCVVIVATIRALKLHGGEEKENLGKENLESLKKGIPNLTRHIENIMGVYNLPVVVAINKFVTDTEKEIELLQNEIKKQNVEAIVCDVWGKGGDGATELAKKVITLCENDNAKFTYSYKLNDTIENKINAIATKIYGANGVKFSDEALKNIEDIKFLGLDNLPVIMAKTQYSLSDNAKLLGRPTNFEINIKELQIRNGAKFIVALSGNILLMPGLSKSPAGENMKISNDGKIEGLF